MITKLLFYSDDVHIECQLPLDKVIANFSHHVAHPKQPIASKDGLAGSVRRDDVFVYCTSVSKRNTFIPTFYGSFSGDENHSVLSGEITLNRFVKKFMLLWIAIVGLVFFATLITLITNPAASFISLVYVFMMLVLAIGILLYIKNNSTPAKTLLKERLHDAVKTSGSAAE